MAVTALITTTDAINQLDLPTGYSDALLPAYIDAATGAVERVKGSIVSKAVVESYDGGRNGIALSHAPVLVLTSVTEAGTLLSAADYTLYPDAGILYRNSGVWAWSTALSVTVSYTAGRTAVDPLWKLAALIVLQDLWATRLAGGPAGPVRPAGAYAERDALTRANYRLPRRAMELLGMALPGIA